MIMLEYKTSSIVPLALANLPLEDGWRNLR